MANTYVNKTRFKEQIQSKHFCSEMAWRQNMSHTNREREREKERKINLHSAMSMSFLSLPTTPCLLHFYSLSLLVSLPHTSTPSYQSVWPDYSVNTLSSAHL